MIAYPVWIIWAVLFVVACLALARLMTTRRPMTATATARERLAQDLARLTREDREVFSKATRLMRQGATADAARLFLAIGFHRYAVTAYDRAGMIDEAARVLIDIGAFDRAGVFYAAHARWQDATTCFRRAQVPLEVAVCAREAGDFAGAATYFEKAGLPHEAAACYEKSAQPWRAARLYLAAGAAAQAAAIVDGLVASDASPPPHALDQHEVAILRDVVQETPHYPNLMRYLSI